MRSVTRRPTRPRRLGVLVLAWAACALFAVPVILPSPAAGVSISVPTLSIGTPANGTLPMGFWGANVRPFYSLNSTVAGMVNATPITTLRWPGGATADELNYTSNVLTQPNGSTFVPPENESDFVRFCRSVHCQAILELPGEIDDPATAASYVAYTIQVLRFTPAYWEIGNEPAVWTHVGAPWSNWSRGTTGNATPTTYAALVHAYIAAIRSAAPAARFIGLPGVGTGGYDEATWIRATVAVNGPNLSAVAIHVYPAGGSTPRSAVTVAGFLSTLTMNGALPHRVPKDLAAIRAGCARCTGIRLFATELGSGTQGGPYTRFMRGFPDLVFLAAELVQAVSLRLANVDVFAWESSYNGSLLTGNGTPTRSYALFSTFLSLLGRDVLPTSLTGAPADLFAVATTNGTLGPTELLIVNANTTTPARLDLTSTGFPLVGAGIAYVWAPNFLGAQATRWTLTAPSTWNLPAESVAVVEVA